MIGKMKEGHLRESSTPLTHDTRWRWGDSLDTKSRGIICMTQSLTANGNGEQYKANSGGMEAALGYLGMWSPGLGLGGLG